MKRVLLILSCISIWLSLSGSTYYISPDGNDSNPGTINQPFYSLSKAWTVVSAGDLVYMRGGTYKYNSQQYLVEKNGNSGNYIKIFAYPGEKPVITRPNSNWTYNRSGDRAGIYVEGDFSGKIVYEKAIYPDIKNIQFPLYLKSGIYYVNLSKDQSTLFDQKLIVKN